MAKNYYKKKGKKVNSFSGVRFCEKQNAEEKKVQDWMPKAPTFDHLNNRPTIDMDTNKVTSNEVHYDEYKNGEDVKYDLVDLDSIRAFVSEDTLCAKCKQFTLELVVTKRLGFATYFEVKCLNKKCKYVRTFSNSIRYRYKVLDKASHDEEIEDEECDEEERSYDCEEGMGEEMDQESHEPGVVSEEAGTSKEKPKEPTYKLVALETINIELVLAARVSGCGYSAMKHFSACMNLNEPPNEHIWSQTQDVLHDAFERRANWSMDRAIEEATRHALETTGFADIAASFDGSWRGHGFNSIVGYTSGASVYLDKLIGVDVRHKTCSVCKGKGDCRLGPDCGKNHKGSSGSMEAEGAKAIVKKIFDDNHVKITKYLGDGDSRAFGRVKQQIGELDLDWTIEKLECANHIAKRIGARLREAVKKIKGLGGRGGGKLTVAVINQIQRYYTWIIYSSEGNVELMQKRILAMFDHIASSDDNPQHDNCDPFFCKYNKIIASDSDNVYYHEDHFHVRKDIMDQVKKIFVDLSSKDLMEKVAHRRTQNTNECANSTLWNLISKNGFSHRGVVELSAYMAVCFYNEGRIAILDVLSSLGVPLGEGMADKFKKEDQLRVQKKARKEAEEKMSRKRKRAERTEDEDESEAEYENGMAPLDE